MSGILLVLSCSYRDFLENKKFIYSGYKCNLNRNKRLFMFIVTLAMLKTFFSAFYSSVQTILPEFLPFIDMYSRRYQIWDFFKL